MSIVACLLYEGAVYIVTSHGDVWRARIDAEGYLSIDEPNDQIPQQVIDAINVKWGEL